MKRKKLILFGTGDVAQLAKFYFDTDSNYEVSAFTVDREYCISDSFENKPLISFDEIVKYFPPKSYEMFIALSYSQMNKLREQKFYEAKSKGYNIASYISSKCTYLSQFQPGENAFIFEDNTIQPYVRIGDNVTLWSGNHIGHHSIVENHNFISSHVVISGHCRIESNCFLGVNSTIAHKITIKKESLIGAGVVISKDTEAEGVYVANRPVKLSKRSSQIKI